MCDNRLEWAGESFVRTEKTFKKDEKKATVFLYHRNQPGKKRIELVFYETPDRNKQRMAVSRQIQEIEQDRHVLEEKHEELLLGMGYEEIKTYLVEGIRYRRNGYTVELTRLKREEDIVNSSEEEAVADIDQEETEENRYLFRKYLVKVYSKTETVADGEKILNIAFHDLNGILKLVKPNLSVF